MCGLLRDAHGDDVGLRPHPGARHASIILEYRGTEDAEQQLYDLVQWATVMKRIDLEFVYTTVTRPSEIEEEATLYGKRGRAAQVWTEHFSRKRNELARL